MKLLFGGNLLNRKALWAIYISNFVGYLGVGLVAPLISLVLSKHGANTVVVGLVGTTMFLAFTVASFPLGRAIDRFGPKRVLVSGLFLYAISILLFALIQTIWLFFAIRAVEGLGAAAISVATETMISHLSDEDKRAQHMSYYGLSVGLGWALGPMMGTTLFSIYSWLPFLACFLFSALSAIMVSRFVNVTSTGNHHFKGIFHILSTKMVMPLTAGAIYGYLMSSLVTLFPLYLYRMGIQEVAMGSIITSVVVGTIISQIPIGKAADRWGKRKVLLACALLLIPIFLSLNLHPHWWSFVSRGFLIGALAGCLYPIGLALVGSIIDRDHTGLATSLFSLFFGLGCLSGPAISGVAMRHLGENWLFYLPAILCGIFVILGISLNGKLKAPR